MKKVRVMFGHGDRRDAVPRRSLGVVMACVAAALSVMAAGCASTGTESGAGAYREDFAEVFGGQDAAGPEGGARSPWAIVVGVYTGMGAFDRAQSAAGRLRESFGLTGARAEPRSNGAVVLVGGYDSPADDRAQRDLARLHEMEIDGATPFRTAFLAPQGGPVEGSFPKLNLANARENHGDGAKYTLQVAVYESEDGREARRAAEEATQAFRRDGELAFYYHGPTKSMVTIGLFGDRDYDPQTGRRSKELRDLQQRFPYNLLNGRTIIERRIGGKRTQPSTLVQVPERR